MTEPNLRELAEASRLDADEEVELIAAHREYRSRRKVAFWKCLAVFVTLIFAAGFIRGAVSEEAGDIAQWFAILGSAAFAWAIWPKKMTSPRP